jgi:site-specific recombinase XerD
MFMIRRGQLLKNQEAPIYMRITVDGEPVEISIKRSIPLERWDEFKRCAKTGTPYAKELNYHLEQIRHKVYDYHHDLIDKNKAISANALKNAYLHSDEEESRTLLKVYADHNADLKSRINKGFSKCTFIKHESSRNNLERFIKATYKKKNDFLLKDIDNEFILKYEVFLRTKRNCNNNSTVKYIRNFGKIIKLALDNDWIKDNPMRKIKLKIEEVNKEFLSNQELQTITDKTLAIPRISQVRDIFVFCCYTGLAYVDVKSLTKTDIIAAPDNTLWIKKQRHKSKIWAHIPILPPAMQILDRYRTNPNCLSKGVLFPVLSNQKMNAYLKEVADLCGIDKKLTTHCARHTFATTVTLANNISMASVSKMLGHTNLSMTMKYAKIQDATIGQEMNQLAEKLQFHMN